MDRAFTTTLLSLAASNTNNHLQNPDGTWRIEKSAEIVEADAGDFSGRDKYTDPEIIAYPHRYDVALPNGESDKEMVERVRIFYDRELMPRIRDGETVLVVSHSGIMIAFEIVAGLRPIPEADIWSNRSSVQNAAPVVIEYEDGQLIKSYQMKNSE